MTTIARGFGRTLDFTTLTVLLRDKLNVEDEAGFCLYFDKQKGWTAWLGLAAPEEAAYYETHDSAMLALLIGADKVPGVSDP